MRNYIHWVFSGLILLIGTIAIYFVYKNQQNNEIENRKLRLEYTHNRAINQFSKSIDKFAAIVAGMKSYMNLSTELPSANEFQKSIQNQLDDLNYQDSIVVSYLDTTHTFVYSFTRNNMDPAGLVGKQVGSLRDDKEIERLVNVMSSDGLKMLYPMNLVEGWVGIPIDFRVRRNGVTMGYVAPLINFKTIIQSVYDDEVVKDYVFHFRTDQGHDFDRESVYDGSRVYNSEPDKEYYKNFKADTTDFIYSTVSYYGQKIKIGTAYKSVHQANTNFNTLLFSWYMTFTVFVILITWQIGRYKLLNDKIKRTNELLSVKQNEVIEQNKQLTVLNETKNRFFSIIGHDIKGPLNSIEGLLSLLQYEEINDPKLKSIVANLGQSTNNTVNLLNNLLRWARSQTGDIEYNPALTDINEIVQDVVTILQPQANDKLVKINNKITEEVPFVVDRNMINTVIRNIVSNAIKFSNKGGKIIISSIIDKNDLRIVIQDNGVGMTTQIMDNLFNLDKHISMRGTAGEVGTGLGLILCQEFIKKHGGRIDVESKQDKGTTFSVLLPFKKKT